MVPDEEEECIHIPGVPKSQCTLCNGRAKRESRNAATGRTFSAMYPGKCSACGDEIEPGDLIGAFERGGYGCLSCWTEHL